MSESGKGMSTIDPERINTLEEWLGAYTAEYKNIKFNAMRGEYCVMGRDGGDEPVKIIPHLRRGKDVIAFLNSVNPTPEDRAAAVAKQEEAATSRVPAIADARATLRDTERQMLDSVAAWRVERQRYAEATLSNDESQRVIAQSAMAERAREIGTHTIRLNAESHSLSGLQYPLREVRSTNPTGDEELLVPRQLIEWASHDDRKVPLAYVIQRRTVAKDRVFLL